MTLAGSTAPSGGLEMAERGVPLPPAENSTRVAPSPQTVAPSTQNAPPGPLVVCPPGPLVIWWIKRDLRVSDNVALAGAVAEAVSRRCSVLPLFLFDAALVAYPDFSWFHLNALCQALADLALRLRACGAELAVLVGEMDELVRRWKPAAIWAHEETGLKASYQRDEAVRALASRQGVVFHEVPHNCTIRRLRSRDERIALVHARLREAEIPTPQVIPQTPALKQWITRADSVPEALRTEAAAELLARVSTAVNRTLADPIPDPRNGVPQMYTRSVQTVESAAAGSELFSADDLGEFIPRGPHLPQRVDETAAHTVLDSFLRRRGHAYSGGMSSPNSAPYAASRLSVHLAWGTVSLRTVFHAHELRLSELKGLPAATQIDGAGAGRWRKSLTSMQQRLFWHDHFVQRLEDEPATEFEPINRAFAAPEHDGFFPEPAAEYERRLTAWLSGMTGYPMVDASIRALRTTGYLPFRMRAMIVSFAIHVLRLSWRDILYPMAGWMADYVPGIHLSQLQMQAALTGINTIRVYSPVKQLMDHDPDAIFARRWIPELAQHPASTLHALPATPVTGYPAGVVDYRTETAIAKGHLYRIKGSAAGREEARRVLDRHGSRKRGRARSG